MRALFTIIFLGFILQLQMAQAQLDLSTSILLKSNTNKNIENYESNRYESRSKKNKQEINTKKSKKNVTGKNQKVNNGLTISTPSIIKEKSSDPPKITEKSSVKERPLSRRRPPLDESPSIHNKSSNKEISVTTKQSPTKEAKTPKEKAAGKTDPMDLFAHFQELLLGLSSENIEKYKHNLPKNDIRLNIIELELATAYIYNESSSDYWHRSYIASGPGIHIAARVWLSPFLGIEGRFLTSFAHEIYATPSKTQQLQINQQWSNIGITFRKYFSQKPLSSHLKYSIFYSEKQLRVPSDSTHRFQLKSSGFKFQFESIVPTTHTYSWFFGSSFSPRLLHDESSTVSTASSGIDPESYGMELWFGGQFLFNRKNQIFWKVLHSIEKNQFESTTASPDPVTAKTLDGVTITDKTTYFQLGVIWGS